MQIDLYGWFPNENAETLAKLIRKHEIKTVIEVGCFLGKSAVFFLNQGCAVLAIDTFKGSVDINKSFAVLKRLPTLKEQFLFNIEASGLKDKMTLFEGASEEAAKQGFTADLVYIDASHEYEDVKNDIIWWQDKAKKVLCGDDYTQFHSGVKKAVDELLPEADKNQRVWFVENV